MRRRSYTLCLPSLLSIGLALMATGCYEHVVAARGPGARNVDLYEPNLEEPDLEQEDAKRQKENGFERWNR